MGVQLVRLTGSKCRRPSPSPLTIGALCGSVLGDEFDDRLAGLVAMGIGQSARVVSHAHPQPPRTIRSSQTR